MLVDSNQNFLESDRSVIPCKNTSALASPVRPDAYFYKQFMAQRCLSGRHLFITDISLEMSILLISVWNRCSWITNTHGPK